MTAARIRTGCAGWSIGTPQRHLFGDGASMLARYATRLHIAEVNSSFYRPHRHETWRRWADSVPPGFRFSAKMPRTISHELSLRGAGPALDRFLSEVDGLGRKLGGLLLQLPPSLAFDGRTAASFFGMLRRRTGVPVACEPRHASWFDARADALLQRHAIARVAADPARVPQAALPGGAATGWTYWRWHGAPRMYYSRYDDAALAALASQVTSCRDVPAWVIFDNTAHGHAVTDALHFQTIAGAIPRARRRHHA